MRAHADLYPEQKNISGKWRHNMWIKKHLLLISVMAAVVVLISGIIGGAVYAQSTNDQSGTTSTGKSLMARVATILGIDQTKLESAFSQAQKEMQSEEMTARLAKLVADGKITQDQADQYKTWIESKPDLPAGTGLGGDGGFRGGPRDQPPAPPTQTPTTSN
jgi:hypothetical protein